MFLSMLVHLIISDSMLKKNLTCSFTYWKNTGWITRWKDRQENVSRRNYYTSDHSCMLFRQCCNHQSMVSWNYHFFTLVMHYTILINFFFLRTITLREDKQDFGCNPQKTIQQLWELPNWSVILNIFDYYLYIINFSVGKIMIPAGILTSCKNSTSETLLNIDKIRRLSKDLYEWTFLIYLEFIDNSSSQVLFRCDETNNDNKNLRLIFSIYFFFSFPSFRSTNDFLKISTTYYQGK